MNIEAVQKFYGAGTTAMWEEILQTPSYGPQIWSNGPDVCAVVFTAAPDLLTDSAKTDPYIAFDDILELPHLERLTKLAELPGLRWEPRAVPKLMFDLQAHDFEFYRAQVKTKNKFTKGSIWNSVRRVERRIDDSEAEAITERKKAVYPDTSWNIVTFTKDYMKGEWVVVEGFVEETRIYELLCVINNNRLYGLLINVTDNPALRKAFSPYTLAHVHTVAQGYVERVQTVDFGMFFGFKNIFGQQPTWYPGLRYATEG